jgi:FkbM family methyltransferase
MSSFHIAGDDLHLLDSPGSDTLDIVAKEMNSDDYGFSRIAFRPGDVVVDVGAHVGIVSIWLARRYPQIKVVAIEPEPTNLAYLRANIAANHADNVIVIPKAVTVDGRGVLIARPPINSGGAGLYYDEVEGYATSHVASETLDAIFAEHVPERCRLLKIDCEGAEHEILPATQVLSRVDWLAGEFHINSRLTAQGHSNDALVGHVAQFVNRDNIAVKCIWMGE